MTIAMLVIVILILVQVTRIGNTICRNQVAQAKLDADRFKQEAARELLNR